MKCLISKLLVTSNTSNMFGTKILEERKSKFNGELKVVRALGLGTYIQAGNLTQSGGIIESMWRNTLKRINSEVLIINNCLILGLGGGTVVKQIHKNWPEAKTTGVDIDPVIVELGKKYLKLDDSLVNIKICDAFNFVSNYTLHPIRYDLVVVDLYVGDKFPKKFESEKFIKSLTKNKLVIFNRLYYKDKKIEAENFGIKLKKVFKNVEEFTPLVNLMYICYN